jgi:formiminotetrahydrofolate cyclodeaminase
MKGLKRMTSLTELNIRQFTEHVSTRHHAMAGATIAASAAMACSLGEACIRISIQHQDTESGREAAEKATERLDDIRQALLTLANEDGVAIAAFATLRDAGQELEGQELLCQLPVDMGVLTVEAATLMQDSRVLVQHHQDDLEMAIRLLDGTARASSLLLDSNLRIWPESDLAAKFEPVLADLRAQFNALQPIEQIRA